MRAALLPLLLTATADTLEIFGGAVFVCRSVAGKHLICAP